MMNKIKMRFNDFVFETNPLYIEVIASRDVKVNSIYGKTVLQTIFAKNLLL